MKSAYKAMQITGPGELEPVERRTPTQAVGELLIAVEACGIYRCPKSHTSSKHTFIITEAT